MMNNTELKTKKKQKNKGREDTYLLKNQGSKYQMIVCAFIVELSSWEFDGVGGSLMDQWNKDDSNGAMDSLKVHEE